MSKSAPRRLIRWAQDLDVRWARRRQPNVRSVVIDARTPMNLAIIEPVYRALKDDARLRFSLMCSSDSQDAQRIRRAAESGMTYTTPGRAAFQRFDAYLAADFLWPVLPRGVPRVQMFHGVAGKYAHVYDRPTRSALGWRQLWFINRRRFANFVACGAINAGSAAARLIGMPKLDRLVDGSLRRDHVLESIGIDPARRAVLYVPTWSPHSSLNTMGEDLIRRLVRAGHAVIVKLHDRSFDLRHVHSGGVDWPARLEPILGAGGGCLVREADATPYLAAADVAITDHSSAGFEYLLLDRPLIRIHVPGLLEQTQIAPEYVELLRNAAVTAHDANSVARAVDAALSEPAAGSVGRRAVAAELFYRPGSATCRAVRELYAMLELEPPATLPSAGGRAPRVASA